MVNRIRIASWAANTMCADDGAPSTPVTRKGVLPALFCDVLSHLSYENQRINRFTYPDNIVVQAKQDSQYQINCSHGQSYANPEVQEHIHPPDIL